MAEWRAEWKAGHLQEGDGVRSRVEPRQEGEGTVSLLAEVPEPLLQAMRAFIERHPNWDQYRLVQAALAGFLVQHAPGDRQITRCYLANLFPGSGRFQPAAGGERDGSPAVRGTDRREESGWQCSASIARSCAVAPGTQGLDASAQAA